MENFTLREGFLMRTLKCTVADRSDRRGRLLGEQFHERPEVDRLHHMALEPGFARFAAIVFLAPAGQRDQENFLTPGLTFRDLN